jgi:hypothetical protein
VPGLQVGLEVGFDLRVGEPPFHSGTLKELVDAALPEHRQAGQEFVVADECCPGVPVIQVRQASKIEHNQHDKRNCRPVDHGNLFPQLKALAKPTAEIVSDSF